MELWYPQLANIHNSTMAKNHVIMTTPETFPTVTPACYIHTSTLQKEHINLSSQRTQQLEVQILMIYLLLFTLNYLINQKITFIEAVELDELVNWVCRSHLLNQKKFVLSDHLKKNQELNSMKLNRVLFNIMYEY